MKSFYIIKSVKNKNNDLSNNWDKIVNYLKKHKIDYYYQNAYLKGDAFKLTKSFIERLPNNKIKNYVIIAIGNLDILNEIINGIKKLDVGDIPIALIPNDDTDSNFINNIGISTQPLIALKQILNTTDAINYSVVEYLENNTQKNYFISEYNVGINANINYIKNYRKTSWIKKHIKWLFNFICLCKAYYNNNDSFNITLKINNHYKFYKNIMMINLENHIYEYSDNKSDCITITIVDKIPFIYFLILILFNKTIKFPFIHKYSFKKIHINIDSIERTQIDNIDIGSKYNNLYINTISYPFWINIDSIPIKSRRN